MSKRAQLALVAMASLAILVGTVPAVAQTQSELLDQYVNTLRQDLMARRDATMRAVVQLTDEEAKKFWPMQKEYDKELQKIGDARKKLLVEWGQVYNNLTPEKAQELATTLFELNAAREDLRRKTFESMSREISPVVAVQFLQLQSQFETMADLKLATYVPIAVREP